VKVGGTPVKADQAQVVGKSAQTGAPEPEALRNWVVREEPAEVGAQNTAESVVTPLRITVAPPPPPVAGTPVEYMV
jgi:hypothetical protein